MASSVGKVCQAKEWHQVEKISRAGSCSPDFVKHTTDSCCLGEGTRGGSTTKRCSDMVLRLLQT